MQEPSQTDVPTSAKGFMRNVPSPLRKASNRCFHDTSRNRQAV